MRLAGGGCSAQNHSAMVKLDQAIVEGVQVLSLRGILAQPGTEAIQPSFAAAVQGAGAAPVVVDLSGVDMIYTPGITMLLAAHHVRLRAGGRLILAGAAERVDDVLRRCRLDRVLTLAADRASAVQAARQQPDAGNAARA